MNDWKKDFSDSNWIEWFLYMGVVWGVPILGMLAIGYDFVPKAFHGPGGVLIFAWIAFWAWRWRDKGL